MWHKNMKVLFVTEYFYPYVHGGAEISVNKLARSLTHSGQDVYILTPNYGTVPFEEIDGAKIHRFFFWKKLTNFSDQLSPSWYFNPLFIFIIFIQIVRIVQLEKIKVIHVHSLFSVPSAILAGKLLKIPVIVTFRDNQVLCNYGYCLTKNQFGLVCDLKNYFFEDFQVYWNDKVQIKNILSFIKQILFAIFGRFRTETLQFFAGKATIMIVSSLAQQKTFLVNGFKTKVIYNIFSFPKNIPNNNQTKQVILYATKMSSGKGLNILLPAFKLVLKDFPQSKLLVIGSGDKEFYRKLSRKLQISKNVEFLSRKSHYEIMEIRKKVLLEVAPSVYPESFGRSALESLASGVPVVASNRGGLTDIVENGKTGYITNPTVNELAEAIVKGVENNQKLRRNIIKKYPALKHKFGEKPLEDHLRLYKNLLE